MDRIREFLFTKYKTQPIDQETLAKKKKLLQLAQTKNNTKNDTKAVKPNVSNNYGLPINKNIPNKTQRIYSGNRKKVSSAVPESIKEESLDSNSFAKGFQTGNKKTIDTKISKSDSSETSEDSDEDVEKSHNTTLRSRSAFEESESASEAESELKSKTIKKEEIKQSDSDSDVDDDDDEDSEQKSDLNETRESLNSSMNSSFKVYKISIQKEKPKEAVKETPKNVYNDNSSKTSRQEDSNSFKAMIRDAIRVPNNDNLNKTGNNVKKTDTKDTSTESESSSESGSESESSKKSESIAIERKEAGNIKLSNNNTSSENTSKNSTKNDSKIDKPSNVQITTNSENSKSLSKTSKPTNVPVNKNNETAKNIQKASKQVNIELKGQTNSESSISLSKTNKPAKVASTTESKKNVAKPNKKPNVPASTNSESSISLSKTSKSNNNISAAKNNENSKSLPKTNKPALANNDKNAKKLNEGSNINAKKAKLTKVETESDTEESDESDTESSKEHSKKMDKQALAKSKTKSDSDSESESEETIVEKKNVKKIDKLKVESESESGTESETESNTETEEKNSKNSKAKPKESVKKESFSETSDESDDQTEEDADATLKDADKTSSFDDGILDEKSIKLIDLKKDESGAKSESQAGTSKAQISKNLDLNEIQDSDGQSTSASSESESEEIIKKPNTTSNNLDPILSTISEKTEQNSKIKSTKPEIKKTTTTEESSSDEDETSETSTEKSTKLEKPKPISARAKTPSPELSSSESSDEQTESKSTVKSKNSSNLNKIRKPARPIIKQENTDIEEQTSSSTSESESETQTLTKNSKSSNSTNKRASSQTASNKQNLISRKDESSKDASETKSQKSSKSELQNVNKEQLNTAVYLKNSKTEKSDSSEDDKKISVNIKKEINESEDDESSFEATTTSSDTPKANIPLKLPTVTKNESQGISETQKTERKTPRDDSSQNSPEIKLADLKLNGTNQIAHENFSTNEDMKLVYEKNPEEKDNSSPQYRVSIDVSPEVPLVTLHQDSKKETNIHFAKEEIDDSATLYESINIEETPTYTEVLKLIAEDDFESVNQLTTENILEIKSSEKPVKAVVSQNNNDDLKLNKALENDQQYDKKSTSSKRDDKISSQTDSEMKLDSLSRRESKNEDDRKSSKSDRKQLSAKKEKDISQFSSHSDLEMSNSEKKPLSARKESSKIKESSQFTSHSDLVDKRELSARKEKDNSQFSSQSDIEMSKNEKKQSSARKESFKAKESIEFSSHSDLDLSKNERKQLSARKESSKDKKNNEFSSNSDADLSKSERKPLSARKENNIEKDMIAQFSSHSDFELYTSEQKLSARKKSKHDYETVLLQNSNPTVQAKNNKNETFHSESENAFSNQTNSTDTINSSHRPVTRPRSISFKDEEKANEVNIVPNDSLEIVKRRKSGSVSAKSKNGETGDIKGILKVSSAKTREEKTVRIVETEKVEQEGNSGKLNAVMSETKKTNENSFTQNINKEKINDKNKQSKIKLPEEIEIKTTELKEVIKTIPANEPIGIIKVAEEPSIQANKQVPQKPAEITEKIKPVQHQISPVIYNTQTEASVAQKILKRVAKSPTKKYKGAKINIVENLTKQTEQQIVKDLEPKQSQNNFNPKNAPVPVPPNVSNEGLKLRYKDTISKSVESDKTGNQQKKQQNQKQQEPEQQPKKNIEIPAAVKKAESAYIVKVLEQKYRVFKEDSIDEMMNRNKKKLKPAKPLFVENNILPTSMYQQKQSRSQSNDDASNVKQKSVRIKLDQHKNDFFEERYDDDDDHIYDPDNYSIKTESMNEDSIIIKRQNISNEIQNVYDKRLGPLSINNAMTSSQKSFNDAEKKNSILKELQREAQMYKSFMDKNANGQFTTRSSQDSFKNDVTIIVEKEERRTTKRANKQFKQLKTTPRYNVVKARSSEDVIRTSSPIKRGLKKSFSNLETGMAKNKRKIHEIPIYQKHDDKSLAKSSNASVLTNESFDIPNVIEMHNNYEDKCIKKNLSSYHLILLKSL